MKFIMLWQVKLNEIEGFALFSWILGIIMVAVGAGWDYIIGVKMAHSEGCGLYQILWMGAWGVYSVWAYAIMDKWSEK